MESLVDLLSTLEFGPRLYRLGRFAFGIINHLFGMLARCLLALDRCKSFLDRRRKTRTCIDPSASNAALADADLVSQKESIVREK
jgi:hypothetical protein